MPIPIQGYYDNSARSELTKAGLGALWFAAGTEAGFNVIGRVAKVGWNATKGTYRAARYVAKPLMTGGLARFAARGTYRGAKMYTPQVRDVIGGGVRGTYKAASWMYRNPVAMLGLAGGAGLAWAMDPSQRSANETYGSPSMVEAMGGNTNAGVSQLMDVMNANGNIVLGMNNRR